MPFRHELTLQLGSNSIEHLKFERTLSLRGQVTGKVEQRPVVGRYGRLGGFGRHQGPELVRKSGIHIGF